LVEGRDAEVLSIAFLAHLNVVDVQVQNFGGVSELQGFLKAFTLLPGFAGTVRSIGLVRDAEGNAAAAGMAVRGALGAANLPVPAQPLTQAGVGSGVTVAYLILPHGGQNGMLETVCLESVSQDVAMPCVDDYFNCLQAAGLAAPNNPTKARVQAFLASRSNSGLLLGQAAHAGYWQWGHAAFDSLRQLIGML
jgi:hypothetical protein